MTFDGAWDQSYCQRGHYPIAPRLPSTHRPAPSTQHPAPTARNCAFVKANTKGVQVQTPISFFVVVGFWHSAAVVVGLAL